MFHFFVRVIPEPIIDEVSLSIFSARILAPVFKINFGISLFDLGRSLLFLIVPIAIASGFALPENILGIISGENEAKNSTNCTILADEPFAKDLLMLETCVLVNNDLCSKLV